MSIRRHKSKASGASEAKGGQKTPKGQAHQKASWVQPESSDATPVSTLVTPLKNNEPMDHLNIADFNRGQASVLIRKLSKEDKVAYIQKHGHPLAILISNERYERMLRQGIDINDY